MSTAGLLPPEPVWFGPDERPLFGWLHRPEGGRARAGVVLCPPVGDEDRRVYLTYRKAAEQLTRSEFAVLRFSYDGTGDSAGSLGDPDRVDAWISSIAHAVGCLRRAGVDQVAAVGMRLGATLLTRATPIIEPPLAAVVLWDPCAGGREFLRHQQLLLTTVPGRPSTDTSGVDTPGYYINASLVDELRGLTIGPVEPPDTRTLVLARPGRPAPERLRAALAPVASEALDAVGQDQLLDVAPLDAVVPVQSIKQITEWLTGAVADEHAVVAESEPGSAVVGTDLDGAPVRERAVRLGSIGLFGITTEPDQGAHGPWMLFINVATEYHIGPGRAWVELARDWARHGIRSIRFDLSGAGDSPVHPGQAEEITYAREWLDDLPAVAAGIAPSDPSDTVFIGLCSGGYGAFEAGLAVGSRGAVAINPGLTAPHMSKLTDLWDPRRRAVRTMPRALARLAVNHGRVATWIWERYKQVAVWHAPMSVPAAAVRAGMDVLLVCGQDEAEPFRDVWYWRARVEPQLHDTGRFDFAVIPTMDHVLLFGEGREAAMQVLTRHVLERYGPATEPQASGPEAGSAAGIVVAMADPGHRPVGVTDEGVPPGGRRSSARSSR
jgi:alpha-beta hydrolase superfamily lysophospholipase